MNTLHIKNIFKIILSTAALLLIPLIMTLITEEVNWSVTDFLVMGLLMALLGSSIYLVMHLVRNRMAKGLTLVAVIMFFFLLWAELAVGIFGSPLAGS